MDDKEKEIEQKIREFERIQLLTELRFKKLKELDEARTTELYSKTNVKRAEERALGAYPHYTAENITEVTNARHFFAKGYEQAEKDIIAIVKEYLEKGLRCMEQSDKSQIHIFWDGFHNCAENILRELEDEE